MSRFVWILDAGHGGVINNEYVTPGKRSPIWPDGSQYFEGVGNRNIVKLMRNRLIEKGIENIDILDGTQEDVPLHDRVYKANQLYYNDNRCVYVSIHSNGFTKESAHGYSIYTSKGETRSDAFADVFYKNMSTYFPGHKARKDFTDGDPDKEANFYVIKKTNCPAVLIENFFMTNYRECKLLMDVSFVNRIVDCHVSSIVEIENSEAFIL